jgi:hypothetical protein
LAILETAITHKVAAVPCASPPSRRGDRIGERRRLFYAIASLPPRSGGNPQRRLR